MNPSIDTTKIIIFTLSAKPGRGGRDRFHRDYPPRSEEKSHHEQNNAPPSRHLWVGNLPHDIAETALAHHFLQFGELESVAFQLGRSYAFINFKTEDDAFAAMKALQGFVVAGNPLRIEFVKADKSSTPSHDEDYLQRRDEQRSAVRGPLFSQRESRTCHSSPNPYDPDKFKMTEKNAQPPSEILWIGFPSLLKVDEVILRKAFSPFGEIEKITTFPGRSYAFVRFRHIAAACRAKETLQGKLFGNPRVHICFSRSESGSSNSRRNSMNSPPSPHFKSYGRKGMSDDFRRDTNFESFPGDPAIISRPFISSLGGALEQRFQDPGPELRLPENNRYEPHNSPPRDRFAQFCDFSPQQFPNKPPFFDDSWDLPDDPLLFHGAKKLKTSSFPPENELPEYPFSGSDQAEHGLHRKFPDFPQPEAPGKFFDSGPFGYKEVPDGPKNLIQPHGKKNWNTPYDSFEASSGSLPPYAVEWKRFTPESHQPSLNEEWKWEGTIAKGGTAICRARCFPVGKVLDMMLPEFLDCTARTGLDMLAKHYYQAAGTWVVFFVPENDADMGFYNEFLHYLGEKQRAAVAKLDERTTLFLVPPSEFSEKVLKVPGKLSISGVILRLENPASDAGPYVHHLHDQKGANIMSYRGDMSYPKPASPSGPFPSVASFPNVGKSGGSDSYAYAIGQTSDQQNCPTGPNWSPPPMQKPNFGARNMASQAFNAPVEPAIQGYNPIMPRAVQETSSSSVTTGISGIPYAGSSKISHQETKPPVSSSMPAIALKPEQLAQLATSLLGQPRQSGSGPAAFVGENFRQSNTMNPSENSSGNQQLQSSGTQEEDADPQKRLQATLQLAAALLQQIQQRKST